MASDQVPYLLPVYLKAGENIFVGWYTDFNSAITASFAAYPQPADDSANSIFEVGPLRVYLDEVIEDTGGRGFRYILRWQVTNISGGDSAFVGVYHVNSEDHLQII